MSKREGVAQDHRRATFGGDDRDVRVTRFAGGTLCSGQVPPREVSTYLTGSLATAADRPEPVSLVMKADEGTPPGTPTASPRTHGTVSFHLLPGLRPWRWQWIATTPATGVRAQCGGDSHLVNFRDSAPRAESHLRA